MEDLLDLDWSNKAPSSPQHSQAAPSRISAGPKDAFADLLSLGSSSSASPPSLNQQRIQQQQQQQQKYLQPITASPMSRYSSTSSSSSSPAVPPQTPSSVVPLAPSPLLPRNTPRTNTLDDLLDPFGKTKQTSTSNVPLNALRTGGGGRGEGGAKGPNHGDAHNPWNFDLMTQDNATASSTQNTLPDSSATVDPFDMDALMNATNVTTATTTTRSLMGCNDDEDNPLGLLAEPVKKPHPFEDESAGRHSPPPAHSPTNNTREATSSPRSLPISPRTAPATTHQHHDALLAQLVDMGFGVEESQVALEESGSVDLQSAIDIIVQQTEAMRRQQQQQQQRPKDESSTPDNIDSPTSETSFQQQKERLVSQASELGGYFYKNASLFVRSGKQKISKVMEEYQQQQQQQQQQQPGRPKWMTDQGVDELDDGGQNGSLEKFVDSDDEGDETENQRMMEQMEQERRHVEALRQKQHKERQQRPKPAFKSRLIQDDDEEENIYVSPSRRRQQPVSRPTTPKRAPTPPPPPPPPSPSRPIVEASPTILASATMHRQKGNELYKLGQFADAEVEYTLAIDTLPSSHDHLILLGNNRAMARLKTGHYKQCIEDCDQVLALTATLQQGATVQSQGGVDIVGRDHIIKALHRKSEALEHLEKYQLALDTYHVLIQWEGTANRKVNQAMARCRQILQPPPQKRSTATATPRSTATPQGNSKAVSAMRAQAAQQEADDAERLAKTDQVNLQLARWKQGKEANLRALLATLDTVLWADAKWTSIQISELIQPKKCKINYLKAIGKVHPDKLPSSVTVEQRMIASGVFSTLNEAWDSFKAENNL